MNPELISFVTNQHENVGNKRNNDVEQEEID